jgi:uncharacterized protein (TIGR02466 family)
MENNKIEILHPHQPYLFKLHYDFNWEKIKPICDELLNDVNNKPIPILNNGISSFTNAKQPHTHYAFHEFYSWLIPKVRDIATQGLGYAFSDNLVISNSWINLQNKGGYTSEHNHAHSFIGVSTYLNIPENGGYFECKDPLELLNSSGYHNSSIWRWKTIKTISGDILVFPAWLIHKTQENNTDEGRYVLTTNFINDFRK